MGFAPKIRFAPDSPLEGNGFEPSVPGTKEPVFVAEGELRDRTGAAKKGCILCGTDGSNPSPSSEESMSRRGRKPANHFEQPSKSGRGRPIRSPVPDQCSLASVRTRTGKMRLMTPLGSAVRQAGF